MAGRQVTHRRLNPDEQALWQQLTRGVRPYRGRARPPEPVADPQAPQPLAPRRVKGRVPAPPPQPAPPPPPRRAPVPVLDRGWEKRIRSGQLRPDHGVDLHGHNLAGAHAALEAALRQAVSEGQRVLLVVTGKPRAGRAEPGGRGAIRAEIGHWLERSPLADRIASVRVAHPRHGGDGALYVILRRER
ncbi:MAG TPA: Smr/MutS family protein [Sphingobium sp.]|nr:Smr/MutS family protein [Sphingobium sp.]